MKLEIYADLRCLQDSQYAFRGIGYHAAEILRAGRKYFPRTEAVWIGLIDPSLPALPAEFEGLVDQISSELRPRKTPGKKLFIETSPMTHDARRFGLFLTGDAILTASIVYDFIPLERPETHLAHSGKTYDYVLNLACLQHYDLLFPISEYSGNRLVELVDIEPRAVQITGVGLRSEFEACYRNAATKLGKPESNVEPFFLFVGGTDRRKNLDVVLRAHARLSVKRKPKLLIVGNYTRKCISDVFFRYRSLGGNPSSIAAKHEIPDRELAGLYRECLCTICSSEIEGFSLPPVEAACCHSPVLLSANEAHLELIDLPEAMFEPHDHVRLANLMQRAIHDREWARQVAELQSGIAGRFLSERVAYRFWGPLSKLQRRQPITSRVLRHKPGRKRLAILTPFPPDRSGVADYTHKAVEQLGKLVDVDVYCDSKHPQPTTGVRNFFRLSEKAFLSSEYDQVLSIVGNSRFHAKIIDLQVKYGGPCLIHDNRLAELYNWRRGPEQFQQMAARSLGRRVSFAEAQEWLHEPGKLQSMFFDELISNAEPLIVHSRGIQQQVKSQYGIDAQYLPFSAYRHFDEEQLSGESKWMKRRELGIPADVIAILTLGLVSPVKAPHACIEALAAVRRQGLNAHLYFVGSCSYRPNHIRKWASRHGVLNEVHLCNEWTDETTYRNYLVAADLGIQLRTHFWGGLSGALMDCISAGLVSIANEDLANALEAPNYVFRVKDRLNPDADEIASSMMHAVSALDTHRRVSLERKHYINQRSFETYAQELVRILKLEEVQHADSSLRAA